MRAHRKHLLDCFFFIFQCRQRHWFPLDWRNISSIVTFIRVDRVDALESIAHAAWRVCGSPCSANRLSTMPLRISTSQQKRTQTRTRRRRIRSRMKKKAVCNNAKTDHCENVSRMIAQKCGCQPPLAINNHHCRFENITLRNSSSWKTASFGNTKRQASDIWYSCEWICKVLDDDKNTVNRHSG